MERLVPLVHDVLHTKERGGRLRRVSWGEVIIYDIGSLSEAQIHRLQAEHIRVSVYCSAESLSGFLVRLRVDAMPTGVLLGTAAVCAALGAVIAHCMELL